MAPPRWLSRGSNLAETVTVFQGFRASTDWRAPSRDRSGYRSLALDRDRSPHRHKACLQERLDTFAFASRVLSSTEWQRRQITEASTMRPVSGEFRRKHSVAAFAKSLTAMPFRAGWVDELVGGQHAASGRCEHIDVDHIALPSVTPMQRNFGLDVAHVEYGVRNTAGIMRCE
jgi:hypothetical protein